MGIDGAYFRPAIDFSTMAMATFEMYEDAEGKWRWRLVHANGNIIADGGEGYASRQKCQQGLRSVKENAPDADVVLLDDPPTV